MKTTLTCSQLADMLGISTTMVRNLEKEGIIAPKRNKDNNYRSYAYIDADRLVRWNYLRSLSFEIPDVKKLQLRDREGFLEIIREQKQNVVRKIVLNSARLSALNELEQDLLRHVNGEESFFDVLPEVYFLPYYDRDEGLLLDDRKIACLEEWIHLFPVSFPFQYSVYENGDWRFQQSGIAISKENAVSLGISTEEAKLFKQQPCVCFITNSWDVDPDMPEKCVSVRVDNGRKIHHVLDQNRLRRSSVVYHKVINTLKDAHQRTSILKLYCSID